MPALGVTMTEDSLAASLVMISPSVIVETALTTPMDVFMICIKCKTYFVKYIHLEVVLLTAVLNPP